jgi:hypothetical protein
MKNGIQKHYPLVLLLAAAGLAVAQEPNPTSTQSPSNAVPMQQVGMRDDVPLYKIQVVARDIPAINYFHRSASTKIGFQGTALLPAAKGTAKVDAHAGRTSIDLNVEGLTPANGFGNEYLTYVLWAITPEGRPVNLGEVLPSGGKDKMEMQVTANLQSFGLIITAEPYYAVTMPSDLVVMQNVVEDRTQGVIEQVSAHYSLLPRGAYADTAGRHAVLNPIRRDERSPLELYEAVNAVQIATAAGADKYAADTMTTAKKQPEKCAGFRHEQARPQGDHYLRARSGSVGGRRAHYHHSQNQGRGRSGHPTGARECGAAGPAIATGRAASAGNCSARGRCTG